MTRARFVVAGCLATLIAAVSCQSQLAPMGQPAPSPASASPALRTGEGLVFDQDRQALVLFAGTAWPNVVVGGHPNVLGDTWEWYDGRGWTQAHPVVAPPARSEPTMVYDPVTQQSLVLGGRDTVGGTVACDDFGKRHCSNDTWAWNGTAWTELHPGGNPTLYGSTASYDNASGRLLTYTFNFGIYNMWTLGGSIWSPESGLPSPGRLKPVMAFDPATGHSLLMGGFSQGAAGLAAMWSWSGHGWTRMGIDSPFARYNPWAATGWSDGRGMLGYQDPVYDGNPPNEVRQLRSQTWNWDGTRWTQLRPAHDPNIFVSAMFDDPKGHRVLMVGDDLAGALQIWSWGGSDWSHLA